MFSKVSKMDNHHYLVAKSNKGYGVLGEEGVVIIPIYDKITLNIEGLRQCCLVFVLEKDGLTGIYSERGKPILDVEYNELKTYGYNFFPSSYSSFLIVSKNDKVGFFDIENNSFVLPVEYDNIAIETDDYKEAIVLNVEKNNKVGLFDTRTFKEILPLEFDKIELWQDYYVDYVEDRIYKVKKNNLSGIFNVTNKKFILQPKYSKINI